MKDRVIDVINSCGAMKFEDDRRPICRRLQYNLVGPSKDNENWYMTSMKRTYIYVSLDVTTRKEHNGDWLFILYTITLRISVLVVLRILLLLSEAKRVKSEREREWSQLRTLKKNNEVGNFWACSEMPHWMFSLFVQHAPLVKKYTHKDFCESKKCVITKSTISLSVVQLV